MENKNKKTTLSYTLNGHTRKKKKILGNVIIDSTADISPSGDLSFTIFAFQIYCEGIAFCEHSHSAGSIRFVSGPPDSGTIVTTSGDWSMGAWYNSGTGVWFRNTDGTIYEGEDGTFGKLEYYKYIAPRIELCADLVNQGPFQPIERVWLTWNPQFHMSFSIFRKIKKD